MPTTKNQHGPNNRQAIKRQADLIRALEAFEQATAEWIKKKPNIVVGHHGYSLPLITSCNYMNATHVHAIFDSKGLGLSRLFSNEIPGWAADGIIQEELWGAMEYWAKNVRRRIEEEIAKAEGWQP